MGAYLSQPNTEKHSEDGEGPANLGIRYGVSEMQGWRMHMEVRFLFSSVGAWPGDFLFYPVGEACDECALPARTTHARRRMLTLPGPS